MTAAEIELEPDAKAAAAVGGASIEAEVEASGGGGSSRSIGEEASLMPVGLSDSCAFDNSKKSFSLEISASDAIERELGPPPSSSLRNLIISSVFGNMLEWCLCELQCGNLKVLLHRGKARGDSESVRSIRGGLLCETARWIHIGLDRR
jgi:hypothetical protein